MKFFFKQKRVGAIPGMIFLVLFFTLLSILGSVSLALDTGNPLNKMTHNLWESKTFKTNAGKYFVSKNLESSTGDERTLLLEKGPQISTALTQLLGNPLFHRELDKISNEVYAYYAGESKKEQSVDLRPIANLALTGLASIDPQFKDLKKEIDKIKPFKLRPQIDGPNVAQILTVLHLALVSLFILACSMLFLYLIFAKSRKEALRWLGVLLLIEGLFLIALFSITKSLIAQQASTSTESLVREALPLGAQPLLAPFLTLGVTELFIGLALFLTSFIKRVKFSHSFRRNLFSGKLGKHSESTVS